MKLVTLLFAAFLLARLVEFVIDLILIVSVGYTTSSLPVSARALLLWNFYLTVFLIYSKYDIGFMAWFLGEQVGKHSNSTFQRFFYLTFFISALYFLVVCSNKYFGPLLVGNIVEVLFLLFAFVLPVLIVRAGLKLR